MDGGKVAANIKFLSQVARIPIKLDEAAMKTAGIAPDATTNLTISGKPLAAELARVCCSTRWAWKRCPAMRRW